MSLFERDNQISGLSMNATQPIRIQILAANDQAGRGSLAVGLVRQHLPQITDIAQSKGAKAMLVCPAPEAYASEGIDIVVAARFGRELAQDVVFWRQHSLADAIHHELQISAVVIDLDGPLDGFLKHIEPLLASPYRDELGGIAGVN
jgi:hypothetical protein